jgi:outer membrane protein OmpA-like peptidoglycan-associated protein
MRIPWLGLAFLLVTTAFTFAQDDRTSPGSENQVTAVTESGIEMIARTTQAIDYRRGDHVDVDLTGTNRMPELNGKAKIISKKGLSDIHVDLQNLRPANAIDAAYLTYVLWTISPQGNAKNIGELVEKDGKASLHATSNMQSFALVVTAEPDFAVSQPSELVVAENAVPANSKAGAEPIQVHYQVFPRSVYVAPARADIYRNMKESPLELIEARNAVAIAQARHADEYAPDALRRAQDMLNQAEDAFSSHHSRKTVVTAAREAVQTAEEARASSVRLEHQARLERQTREAHERAQAAETEAAAAQKEADKAAADRRAAEQQAQEERDRAEQARKQAMEEAEQRRHLEQQNQAAQQQAQQAQQEADLQRQQAEQAQQQAQQEAQQRTAAEQQAQQTAQQVDEARRQAQEAQQRAEQAESQQQQLRSQLRDQLNQILETRDTARGLIVSMPDVLFDLNSAALKATARERLAKVSGILIGHPDIRVEVDGYTDSTGDPSFNEQLSEQRAASVQTYLAQQGVPAGSISIHGFGQANPVASNDTASGRQQNRRVELVVSGESIGTQADMQQ